MMKHSDQITIVDPTINTPAWRNVSPKNLNTRPRKISPNARPPNLTMSPNEATQSRGTASHPIIDRPVPGRSSGGGRPRGAAMYESLDHADFGMGGEQRLREDVVEREHTQERDHDGLVDRPTHPLGATRGGHAL